MSKYQLIERERKFLLANGQVDTAGLHEKKITDYYVSNTMLRFRIVVDDVAEQCKLTKKTPLDAFGETAITTIYLDKQEFETVNIFSSVVVTKIRYLLQLGLVVVGLDHYKNGTDELWLAEVEFSTERAMRDFELPLPYVREVTGIPEYDGYALAKRFQQN